MIAGGAPADVTVLTAVVAVLLAAQLAVIRPRLGRHSSQVLAGAERPRSRAHLSYVAFEVAKVLALTGLGVSVLHGAQW